MTAPAGGLAYDPQNTLLAPTPCLLLTTTAELGGKQHLVVTIRTASTTCTVLLDGAEAKQWAAHLTRSADGMSQSGLIAAGGGIAKPVTPREKAARN